MKELIKQYFDYFNNHDWDGMASMYSTISEFKDPSLGKRIVKQTKNDIIKKYSDLNKYFPDLHDEIIQVYESNNNIIVEFISTGTAPDGSKLELPICTIFTFENGKIVRDFTYYDNSD